MQDPQHCTAQCRECWASAGAASSAPWPHNFEQRGGRKASGKCTHLWELLDFHFLSRGHGEASGAMLRGSPGAVLRLPADNWDVGGFLAFQRYQQKVRTSPLPHSPFLRRHHRHCLIRKTSTVGKTLPTPIHRRYSMCTWFCSLLPKKSCNSCLKGKCGSPRSCPSR